jgi:osmotically-inducible protein OsmY
MAAATTALTDEQLQREVMAELKWEPRIRPNEIGVAVKNGVVTLSGFVDSFQAKWAAEEAALRVHGVRAVANEIEVRLPNIGERTDVDIARAIVEALEWDSVVPADRIKVTVSKGWVTLEGEVEWQYQKEDAERIARRIVGVKGVANLIHIRPKVSPDDLKQKIEQALIRNALTDAKNIQVEVQGSKVVLKGSVRSHAEKVEAARVAWSSPGVTAVENQLVVTG